MSHKLEIVMFSLSIVMFLILIFLLRKERKTDNRNRLYTSFISLCKLFLIYLIGLVAQILYINFGSDQTKLIYFDYFVYIGATYMPVWFFIISKLFQDGKANLRKYRWIYIFATAILLTLFTNDFHHLFYKEYSIYYSETEFGIAGVVFAVFSYALYILSVVNMVRYSINKSGMFTTQSMLIILGILLPLMGNFIGIVQIANTTIYFQAMLFTATILLFWLAIIKYRVLNVIPIATKTIVNTMTDSYMVLSKDGTIADINKTCIDKFAPLMELKQNDNFFEKIKDRKTIKLEEVQGVILEAVKAEGTITKERHIQKGEYDKYFEIDIQPIKARKGGEYVATLFLIRDVTQAKKDIEIMTKNENLVILGELAGGVAHDINTPISAIKSGITMLKTTNKNDDEKMLLDSMDRCADKIIALVNSLRNQIRNIGGDTVTDINIESTLNDIKIILNNELKKNNVELNINANSEVFVKGNPTKLSQVFTNIITNAIQAYNNKGGRVDVVIDKIDNEAVITIRDYALGIPESVRPYIFKNILTTKGVSGTGFGLYLAYSIVKGAFGGEISFETETGKGTVFKVFIPIN